MADKISIVLPLRNRTDFNIETYNDAEGKFRWHMTYAHDTEEGETQIAAAASEGFTHLGDCVVDGYLATGWLPDNFEVIASG